MEMTPEWSLMMVAVVLVMGASNWRRKRLRRAARDLPTKMRRLLGPEPEFDLPDEVPEGLAGYEALHKRTLKVQNTIWLLAIGWAAWVVFKMIGGGA